MRDWSFLRKIVAESDDCIQQLHIRWPREDVFGRHNAPLSNDIEQFDGVEGSSQNAFVFSKEGSSMTGTLRRFEDKKKILRKIIN